MPVDFRILGPLEVRADGSPLPLGGVKQRALLAVLLLHANEALTSDRLIDELWGDRPPPTAANTLQVHLSRLRRTLAAADGHAPGIVRRGDGYRLELAPEQLDRNRFEALAAAGRAAQATGDDARAAELLREALALWRGPALADLRYEPFADAAVAQLEELRLAALKDRIDADLALGRHDEVVAELAALVDAHPLDERLRGQRMLALYRCGRQAEALDAYAAARRALDDLGLEPGEELRRLQVRILQQDPELSQSADAPAATADRRRRRPFLLAALAVAVASVALAASTLRGGDRAVVPPNAVAIVDPASNGLVGWIAVGAEPTRAAAGGGSLWVVNSGDHTLSRVDPSRREVVDTVPLRALAPSAVAANESSVWVVGTVGNASSLVRVDPRFGQVVETLELGELIPEGYGLGSPKGPGAVAWGSGELWTAGPRGDLYRLRPRTLEIEAELATEGGIRALAVVEDALWAVLGTSVVRIDPVDRTHQRFAVGLGAGPVAIAADDRAAWAVSPVDDLVSRIDAVTGTVTGVAVGDRPRDVALGLGSVWVANSNDGTVSRIDAESRQVVATIDLGVRVEGVAVADGLVWVTGHSLLEAPEG